MVDPHPDSDTLLAFREHRLSGSEVAGVAVHLGRCSQCAKAEPAAAKAAFLALAEEEHLSDEELDALVDDPRIVSRHVAMCAMCRAELDDLRLWSGGLQPAENRWAKAHRSTWLIAAAALIAVLALSVVAIILQRPDPVIPVTASNPPAPVAPAPVVPGVIASLADAGGRIELREDGTIAGIEMQSTRDAADARAVLSGQTIAIPTFIAAMPGAVRGSDTSKHPLRAIEPFRSAVHETRPRFSWRPLRDARSYRVAVFDADYEEIARSESLTRTSWTPSQPLPAGVDLSWHVVAETDAGEISSAGSNRGEAVFRVLGSKERAEVEAGEAHYRDSHLLRGLLYSRHGLLHDAEREFRALEKQNPGSSVAKTLIDSVSR